MSLADNLIRLVRSTIAKSRHFPPELFATWDYVCGEDRVCHQRTTALLAHAAWMLPTSPAVEQEDCFVVGSEPHPHKPGRKVPIKWHPDLVLKDDEGKILLLVDFESPNSSDFRVIQRDIERWYLNWIVSGLGATEYLIITSLPDASPPAWYCRYSKADGYESAKAKMNPFRYWYGIYRARFKTKWKKYPITFANFNGNKLSRVDLDAI